MSVPAVFAMRECHLVLTTVTPLSCPWTFLAVGETLTRSVPNDPRPDTVLPSSLMSRQRLSEMTAFWLTPWSLPFWQSD